MMNQLGNVTASNKNVWLSFIFQQTNGWGFPVHPDEFRMNSRFDYERINNETKQRRQRGMMWHVEVASVEK